MSKEKIADPARGNKYINIIGPQGDIQEYYWPSEQEQQQAAAALKLQEEEDAAILEEKNKKSDDKMVGVNPKKCCVIQNHDKTKIEW